MRKYVLNTQTMQLGYLEEGLFYPLAMYWSKGDCGTQMEIINLEEHISYDEW